MKNLSTVTRETTFGLQREVYDEAVLLRLDEIKPVRDEKFRLSYMELINNFNCIDAKQL